MQLLFWVLYLPATYFLTGNKKPGGKRIPSAPPVFERNWKLIRGRLTPPVLLTSIRDDKMYNATYFNYKIKSTKRKRIPHFIAVK